MFHNDKQITQSINQRVYQKSIDKQDKIEVDSFIIYTLNPYLGIMWPMCWDKVWRHFQSLRREPACQNLPQQADTLFQLQFIIYFQWKHDFNNI